MHKLTTEEFIRRAQFVHGTKFDYSHTLYINRNKKVQIKCNICFDVFFQFPMNHIKSNFGCPNCSNKKPLTTQTFVLKAIKKHPSNKYDYSEVEYINNATKVKINCNDCHTSFMQTPRDHLVGYGCFVCMIQNKKWTREELIEQFIEIHENDYDYSEVIYTGIENHIKIFCNKCQKLFEQKPRFHLGGSGCPNCAGHISKVEIGWLDSLHIPEEYRQIRLPIKVGSKNYIIADAYDPSTNTIYEFNGDYWHGNPKIFDPHDINKNNKKSFGELYAATLSKEKMLIEAGYNVISIWESERKNIA